MNKENSFLIKKLEEMPGTILNHELALIELTTRQATDMKGFTDENAGGQTIDDIRSDIRDALKALRKESAKPPKVEFDSKTGRGDAPKIEDPKVCAIMGCSFIAEQISTPTFSSGMYCRQHFDEINTEKNTPASETCLDSEVVRRSIDKILQTNATTTDQIGTIVLQTCNQNEVQARRCISEVVATLASMKKTPTETSHKSPEVKPLVEAFTKINTLMANKLVEEVERKKRDESKVPKAQDISPTATKSPEPEQKKPVKVISCCVCGYEIPHADALKQAEDGIRPAEMKHVECEAKNPEPKEKIMDSDNLPPKQAPKEPEILPPKAKPKTDKEISDAIEAAQNAKKPKNALIVGTCADLAKQYGIPAELANMYFMTLNDGLYIKNPGLLYLASKKGYGRIEVETEYNEKTQEYESTCKIYPKITKDIIEGISKLSPEMQKTAWDYATAPTNGTGRASKASVKMSTMHPFLKEMSQTRAQNRALRAYTGYGGTSLEELPDAEVKCIEG